jgi:hypothetical protein
MLGGLLNSIDVDVLDLGGQHLDPALQGAGI